MPTPHGPSPTRLYRERCGFRIPPLRERIEDLPILVRDIVEDLSLRDGRDRPPDVPAQTLRALAERPWPANLRELGATLDAALPRCKGEALLPEHLPPPLSLVPARALRTLRVGQREAVRQAMEACDGNKREAARLLGISPGRLYRALAGAEGQ